MHHAQEFEHREGSFKALLQSLDTHICASPGTALLQWNCIRIFVAILLNTSGGRFCTFNLDIKFQSVNSIYLHHIRITHTVVFHQLHPITHA